MSRLLRAIFIAALAALCTASSGGDDTLGARMRQQLEADHVPGLAFAVVRGGRLIRSGAYGYANLEWRAAVSQHTKFEIASISKMFAGAAARILIEEGKLDPESPVGGFFHGIPASWDGMKVRHLITMSSGLPEDFASDLIPYDQDVTTAFDDASMVRAFFNLKMAAPVGERFVYSSPNYAMLGMIVSTIAREPFQQFVRERVFAPAGMTDTSYIDNSLVVPERAEGYRRTQTGELRKGWYLGQYLHSRPDVGILATASDLARWLIALEGGRIVRDPEQLWRTTASDAGIPLDYAYGWIQDTWLGHRSVEHSGGYRTGFHTFIERFPDEDLGVVVLTNCDFSPVRDYVNLIAHEYIRDVPTPAAQETDGDPARTHTAVAAIQSLAAHTIDQRVMFADAVEPFGLDGISEFLHPARDFRLAARATVPHGGMTMHGHRLVDFDTVGMTIDGRTQFITLYRDASGKIAYLETTN